MHCLYRIPLFFFNRICPSKIHGKENIPEGKAVIVSNHIHAMDCAYIAKIYNKDIYFLAKKELFTKKFRIKLLKSLGGLPIDRENPDMKSLMTAIKVLKEGHKLVIFPEGTRNKTGTTELQPIKGGAMVFAVKAKSPIVPIMIDRKLRLFRRTHVIVGKPFELSEFYDKKLTDEDMEAMNIIVADKMKEQQAILKEELAQKKQKKGKKNGNIKG